MPDGIDVYFENVAGPVFDAVRRHLNLYARIPVCGLVANYNATGAPEGADELPGFLGQILTQSLTVRGFIQSEFVPGHYKDFLREMGGWVADGSVATARTSSRVSSTPPTAFAGMLHGKNFGKLLVKVG